MRRPTIVATLLLGVLTGGLVAQEGAPAEEARDVRVDRERPANTPEARRAIGQLKSPYCPGLMLEVCPSQPAVLLRDSIREMALDGHSADEIVDWMLANHGEEWRAVPRMAGWGIWAWLLPPLMLVVGGGVLVAYLRRHQRPGMPESEDDDPTSEDEERLREALAALDEEDG